MSPDFLLLPHQWVHGFLLDRHLVTSTKCAIQSKRQKQGFAQWRTSCHDAPQEAAARNDADPAVEVSCIVGSHNVLLIPSHARVTCWLHTLVWQHSQVLHTSCAARMQPSLFPQYHSLSLPCLIWPTKAVQLSSPIMHGLMAW